jgi:hypothetical protein
MKCRSETAAGRARYDGDVLHGVAAVGADGEVAPGELAVVTVMLVCDLGLVGFSPEIEQATTWGEALGAGAIGQEAIVTNAMEIGSGSVWRRKRRMNSPASYVAVRERREPAVGDGDGDGYSGRDRRAPARVRRRAPWRGRPNRGGVTRRAVLRRRRAAQAWRDRRRTRLSVSRALRSRASGTGSEEARQDPHRQKEVFPAGDPALAVKCGTAAGHHAMDMG